MRTKRVKVVLEHHEWVAVLKAANHVLDTDVDAEPFMSELEVAELYNARQALEAAEEEET